MEFLTNLINEKINQKLWTPFKFKNNPTPFSHLLFADDILLFSKATPNSIQTIQDTLLTFSEFIGLTINPEKSKAWFSKMVSDQYINLVWNTLNIRPSSNLGLYLGYPLKPGYKSMDFNLILDKINAKLQGWKANLLSKIARTELINSSI